MKKDAATQPLVGQVPLFVAERLLDMPIRKGAAPCSLVVGGEPSILGGSAFLTLTNLETPLVWKLALPRRLNKGPADMAGLRWGSRNTHALAAPFGVDAMPGATVADGADAIANGNAEFGLQSDGHHEYFFSKFGDLVGIVNIKRREDGGWLASMSKTSLPRVLGKEAVRDGIMPPAGHSALPKSLESVVPQQYRYWQSSGPQAVAMRDALVESKFLAEDCIRAVDGELRKVETKFYLYTPEPDLPSVKAAEPVTFSAAVSDIIPPHLMGQGFNPFTDRSEDWLEALDKEDKDGALAIMSSPTTDVTAREIVRAVATLKADWLIEVPDTRRARIALGKAGPLFKLACAPERILATSFTPPPALVEWVAKADAEKSVTFQDIAILIDRPKGFVQTGKDKDGVEWSRTYQTDYGFFPQTKGGDGEDLDVFVGPNAESTRVFWATQKKDDGSFDEYKVFVGYDTEVAALQVYAAHIPTKFLADMTETSVGMLKALLDLEPSEILKRFTSKVTKLAGISAEQLRAAVNAALDKSVPRKKGDMCCGPYIVELYDDRVVYENGGASNSDFYQVGYTFDVEKDMVLLDGAHVQVARTYVPVTTSKLTLKSEDDDVKQRLLAVYDRRLKVGKAEGSADQQYVLGIVLEPDIIDSQDDTYSAEEIMQAEHKFMTDYRNMGLMHKKNVNEDVRILESYLAPVAFKLGDIDIKKGTWLMGVRVENPALWKQVKDGELTGFSIGGSAIRKPVQDGV